MQGIRLGPCNISWIYTDHKSICLNNIYVIKGESVIDVTCVMLSPLGFHFIMAWMENTTKLSDDYDINHRPHEPARAAEIRSTFERQLGTRNCTITRATWLVVVLLHALRTITFVFFCCLLTTVVYCTAAAVPLWCRLSINSVGCRLYWLPVGSLGTDDIYPVW